MSSETDDLLDFDDNRLRQDTITNVGWQWDNNPDSCREALRYAHDDSGIALNHLKDRQAHNQAVQRLYDVAHSRLADFWDIVATTSYGHANFDEARNPNLSWQYENNLGSLDAADREWRRGRKYSALYELLTGQQQNKSVMHLYRACYAADANRLFGIVAAILGR